jgi:hypothetical protein
MTIEDGGHDEVESLLGAYALDAVLPDERKRVDLHLEDCPRCRAELDAFLEVAAALGNSVDPVPHDLWDRIAGQLDLSTPGDATLIEIREKARNQLAGSDGRRSVASSRAARWRRAAMIGVTSAAAVALALVSLSLSNADDRVNQLQALTAARGASAGAQAVLASSNHKLVQLTNSSGAQLATIVLSSSGTGYLLASHLRTLPATKTYQLWAKVNARPISLGLLGTQPTRDAAFSIAGSAHPSSLMVTVEPAGGVTEPNGPLVAVGPVLT